jgi:oligopeptide/dipeptide ABC transporter ATP-binding protein
MSQPLLEVEDLAVRFATRDGPVTALHGLSCTLGEGEILGLVGESGSGKTQAALAILGLLAPNGRASGRARFRGCDLIALPLGELQRLRGDRIAMVFQDPMTALNPYLRIGVQMQLALRRHRRVSARAAREACAAMLAAVQVTDPGRRLDMYPHELSGGMRQRVMIATALLCKPDLLIADEPTTALDVTVQAGILRLLAQLRREHGTAILFITHDLGIVAGLCDSMLVLRQGRCVEQGAVPEVLAGPRTDYTRELLAAVPRLDQPGPEPVSMAGSAVGPVTRSVTRPVAAAMAGPGRSPDTGNGEGTDTDTPVLSARGVSVTFTLPRPRPFAPAPRLQAVVDASLDVRRGETLGIVGESGSGKSTLARAVLWLIPPTAGHVLLLGRSLRDLCAADLRAQRRHAQLVFQDPFAALDPRLTIRHIVAEPLSVFAPALGREAVTERVRQALEDVGLDAAVMGRYPHQLSGGQCQRVGIARALVLEPALLVCDEPVSALDVTVQAQVMRLLARVQRERGLAMLFIAHDLAVVRALCHRVLVMYLGRTMESGDAGAIYRDPRHPYTRALLRAVPVVDAGAARSFEAAVAAPELPSPLAPPSGCVYRTRCPLATRRCADEVPAPREIAGRLVACHYADDAGLAA